MQARTPNLTYAVELPGGQNRLRQLILYVADRCRDAQRFGHIKLNKILWKSDFESYSVRKVPITGRRYQREKFGPVPKEMLPLHRDMIRHGLIRVDDVDFGDGVVEHRTMPLISPDLTLFGDEDLAFVEGSIAYYWNMTGMESSDDSHGVAWKTRANGEPLPYESAFLSDRGVAAPQMLRLQRLAFSQGWTSE